jgi:hypothetical protein
LQTFTGHTAGVWSADFSHDGKWIVTASKDGTGCLWDASTGQPLKVLEGHAQGLNTAHFNFEGTRVITSSSDHAARVWQVPSGRAVALLLASANWLGEARFSHDERSVVTAGGDLTIRRWEALGAPEPVPRWWPDFLRWVAQRTLDEETGQLILLPSQTLGKMRTKVELGLTVDRTRYADIARWFLTASAARPLRPGSAKTASKVADELITDDAPPEDLNRAYDLDPTHPLIHLALAREANVAARARFLLEFGLKHFPADASPELKARAAALQGEPKTVSALRARSQVLMQLKRLPEASTSYRRLSAFPDLTVDELLSTAYNVSKTGDEKVARAILREASVRFPNHPSILYQTAWCCINLHHPEEARAALRAWQALRKGAEAPSAAMLRGMAIACWSIKAKNEAITAYQQLIAAEPKWADAKTLAMLAWPNWSDAEKSPLMEVRTATLKAHPELAPKPDTAAE